MKFTRRRFRLRSQELGPRNAKAALHSVLANNGIAREIREHRLLVQWHKVVGPRVAKHTTPDGLDKGVLWVRVDSSTWMHQLSFLREEVIQKANELCGKTVITDVRFHLGRCMTRSDDVIAAAARIRRPPLQKRALPPPAQGPQLQRIQGEAAAVDDPELREAIIDVRRRLNL